MKSAYKILELTAEQIHSFKDRMGLLPKAAYKPIETPQEASDRNHEQERIMRNLLAARKPKKVKKKGQWIKLEK